MTEIPTTDTGAVAHTRRQVLLTSGTVVVAAAVTAACGSSGGDSTTAAPTGGSGSTAGSGSGGTTVAVSDVPVGGGTILRDQKVVVTQPQEGTFKAFTAVCTHQGCIVSTVADGNIDCACHGSMFSASDGSVVQGPARNPLAPVDITVSGDTITLA